MQNTTLLRLCLFQIHPQAHPAVVLACVPWWQITLDPSAGTKEKGRGPECLFNNLFVHGSLEAFLSNILKGTCKEQSSLRLRRDGEDDACKVSAFNRMQADMNAFSY